VTRQFCDRCGGDITDKKSSAVSIVTDADSHGNGSVTAHADLCHVCRRCLERWLKVPLRAKAKR
jgi:hypothetical protein